MRRLADRVKRIEASRPKPPQPPREVSVDEMLPDSPDADRAIVREAREICARDEASRLEDQALNRTCWQREMLECGVPADKIHTGDGWCYVDPEKRRAWDTRKKAETEILRRSVAILDAAVEREKQQTTCS